MRCTGGVLPAGNEGNAVDKVQRSHHDVLVGFVRHDALQPVGRFNLYEGQQFLLRVSLDVLLQRPIAKAPGQVVAELNGGDEAAPSDGPVHPR